MPIFSVDGKEFPLPKNHDGSFYNDWRQWANVLPVRLIDHLRPPITSVCSTREKAEHPKKSDGHPVVFKHKKESSSALNRIIILTPMHFDTQA